LVARLSRRRAGRDKQRYWAPSRSAGVRILRTTNVRLGSVAPPADCAANMRRHTRYRRAVARNASLLSPLPRTRCGRTTRCLDGVLSARSSMAVLRDGNGVRGVCLPYTLSHLSRAARWIYLYRWRPQNSSRAPGDAKRCAGRGGRCGASRRLGRGRLLMRKAQRRGGGSCVRNVSTIPIFCLLPPLAVLRASSPPSPYPRRWWTGRGRAFSAAIGTGKAWAGGEHAGGGRHGDRRGRRRGG